MRKREECAEKLRALHEENEILVSLPTDNIGVFGGCGPGEAKASLLEELFEPIGDEDTPIGISQVCLIKSKAFNLARNEIFYLCGSS